MYDTMLIKIQIANLKRHAEAIETEMSVLKTEIKNLERFRYLEHVADRIIQIDAELTKKNAEAQTFKSRAYDLTIVQKVLDGDTRS